MKQFSVACHLIRFPGEPRENPNAGSAGVASARFHSSPAAASGRGEGESGVAAKFRLLQGDTHRC